VLFRSPNIFLPTAANSASAAGLLLPSPSKLQSNDGTVTLDATLEGALEGALVVTSPIPGTHCVAISYPLCLYIKLLAI
jgi:hypothetical protein